MDEDGNRHLNFRSYVVQIEETLMHYKQELASNQWLSYSLSIVYWKELRVSRYAHCFVNVCRQEKVVVVEEASGKQHVGCDLYGTVSVCAACCERRDGVDGEDCQRHVWVHHAGFVARCFDKKATQSSKL